MLEHQARHAPAPAKRGQSVPGFGPGAGLVRHDGGRIVGAREDLFLGLAAPWNRVARIERHLSTFDEVLMPGCFTGSIRARPVLPILLEHKIGLVIGETVDLTEAADGLRVAFRVDEESIAGRLRDLRDGWRVGLSIGFEPCRHRFTPGAKRSSGRDLIERLAVDLYEISVCRRPAYQAAGLAAA